MRRTGANPAMVPGTTRSSGAASCRPSAPCSDRAAARLRSGFHGALRRADQSRADHASADDRRDERRRSAHFGAAGQAFDELLAASNASETER